MAKVQNFDRAFKRSISGGTNLLEEETKDTAQKAARGSIAVNSIANPDNAFFSSQTSKSEGSDKDEEEKQEQKESDRQAARAMEEQYELQ